MKEFKWPLINDSITSGDKIDLIDFITKDGVRFTQGEQVKNFEDAWSNWLGVDYSVFVNSGASSNYIMASIMKEMSGLGEVIVSPIGWVSDIAPLVNLGFTPVFVDVSLDNMSITFDNIKNAITDKTVGITLVHCMGFNAINEDIIKLAKDKNIFLIEDCCESHGATYNTKNVGTFGDLSNFSFYFGHHITTIEGGMICTNNKLLYHYAKLYRSHGMTRELPISEQEIYNDLYPELDPLFTFAVPGYNVRNQEMNAILGLSQLKRLNYNIKRRRQNLKCWLSYLDSDKFFVDFNVIGSSNFALPLILNDKYTDKILDVCKILDECKVEYRRGTAGGGDQTRQPYLEDYTYRKDGYLNVTNHIHKYGLYIGNHPELKMKEINLLCNKLNKGI